MKTTKSIAESAAWSLVAALLVPGMTHAQVSNPIPYKLNAGSTYQTGCFPPCVCPLSQEFELAGTFTLPCAEDFPGAQGTVRRFAMRDIEWTVSLPDSPDASLPVVGFGTYFLDERVARSHEMHLMLVIESGPVRRLDAPDQFNDGPRFPSFRIRATNNKMSCQDTVIVVDASPVGACCPNGPDDTACLIATETECISQAGAYQGDGSTCPTEPGALCGVAEGVIFTCPFPPWEPCCFPSPAPSQPACFISSEQECTAAGGTFLGSVQCDPVLCDATPLACCQSDDTCSTLNLERCAERQSVALGPGSSCGTTDCASVVGGACCAADQSVFIPCFLATPEACAFAGGAYQGDGSTCPPVAEELCGPYTGACCKANANATEATCDVTTFDACLADDGIYQGDFTACGAGECDCCFPLRSCTTMPAGVCSDTLSRLPAIPAVSAWGALVMALLLGAVGSAIIVRPRGTA